MLDEDELGYKLPGGSQIQPPSWYVMVFLSRFEDKRCTHLPSAMELLWRVTL